MRKIIFLPVIFLFGIIIFMPATAWPIAPTFISDEELAKYPVIVVAKWRKAPMKPQDLITKDAIGEMESLTEISVEQVVKGNIQVGNHEIIIGAFIGWENNGGQIISYTSKQVFGDVKEVADLNLWFVSYRKSRNKNDHNTYLVLDTYRGVQPIELEPYFLALKSSNPQTEIPKLLSSESPMLVLRCLEYIAGGILPWPYEPSEIEEFIMHSKEKKKPIYEQADAVEKLLGRKEELIRRNAAAVFAKLSGNKCIPLMRELLSDKDPDIRAIAIGILSQYRDIQSTEAICKAVEGIADAEMACKVVDEIAKWREDKIVPALIAFLQNDKFAYRIGNDWGIPALKAQVALMEITGHLFPLDVKASQRVWSNAKTIIDKQAREEFLSNELFCDPEPLSAEFIGNKDDIFVLIRNKSKQGMTLAKYPTEIDYDHNGGVSGQGFDQINDKNLFVELEPGGTTQFKVEFNEYFISSGPSGKATLIYIRNGNEFGVNAWIGTVIVNFGDKWVESQRIKIMEEKWPNGNLKCQGETINGKKHGVWIYWREDGTKESEVEYLNDCVVSEKRFK